MWHGEFRDRRLVEVYDAECPWARDDDFFVSVVGERPTSRVLDLGCGTGRLALGLAAAGYAVTGVDPAAASLAAARVKPGAEQVEWVEGRSATLPEYAFDVAVMTSHVAQLFIEDGDWARTLADLHRTLVGRGRLTFDSRDPNARAWERWNPVDSKRAIPLVDGRVVTAFTEVTSIADGTVSFVHEYTFPDGTVLHGELALRFRTEAELRDSLLRAGFSVDAIYGGWGREPVGAGHGELLVIATLDE